MAEANKKALEAQVSTLGSLLSKLSALEDAATKLADDGTVGLTASEHTSFSATPGSNAYAGSYQVQVQQLARAAKARSNAFTSGETARGMDLTFTVEGTDYVVSTVDGDTLADIAFKINQSGAPVRAVVLDTGTEQYLSVTTEETGHRLGQPASDALAVSVSYTGATGTNLTLSITQTAQNAQLTVDGLLFERRTNTVTDAVPDTTLKLEQVGAAEDLVLENDVDATKAKLETFVDAYNDVLSTIQSQLDVDESTNREISLAGDSTIRSLQGRLQQIVTSVVSGLSDVRTLADIGIETGRDGSLSIDESTLADALSRDPQAVNTLFSEATTGIGSLVGALHDDYANSADGLLVNRKKSLNETIGRIEEDIRKMEERLDAYRESLVAQFVAMERTVSGLNSLGSYLSTSLTGSLPQ
ncbi:MAG: flagellar hook protein FliD [Deltaproteobacteria bacterium]|nr:MAG: flagellar hook protein FliD [Deltaproteobacteria bacterium]